MPVVLNLMFRYTNFLGERIWRRNNERGNYRTQFTEGI